MLIEGKLIKPEDSSIVFITVWRHRFNFKYSHIYWEALKDIQGGFEFHVMLEHTEGVLPRIGGRGPIPKFNLFVPDNLFESI